MERYLQQLHTATRALNRAVEASIHATNLVLHGKNAHDELEYADQLKQTADAEWNKVKACDLTPAH